MKNYLRRYASSFLILTIINVILAMYVVRRYDMNLPYLAFTISTFINSAFVALARSVFKSEKGNAVVNSILAYVLIIPVLYIIREVYGSVLFRLSYTIYIVLAIILIIYGIGLLVAKKRYKSEVDELNRLLLDKDNSEDDDE